MEGTFAELWIRMIDYSELEMLIENNKCARYLARR